MTTDFIQLANQGISALQPYQPGKPIDELEREMGITNSIKLASNENPLGPSPKALEAIASHLGGLSYYPDGGGYNLKHVLANTLGVDDEQVTIGNGSNEILELIAHAWLGPDKEVIFSQHAFAVYPIVSQAVGATLRVAGANPEDHQSPLGHNLAEILDLINAKTRVIFIANPNNPTGTWLTKTELDAFLDKVPDHIVVVLDEAYVEYVNEDDYPDGIGYLKQHDNLIVTRTFSKIYGLAGLRIGYGVSSPQMADVLNRIRQPFNTNSLAQVAATAAISDGSHVAHSKAVNMAGLAQYEKAFQQRGIFYIPSVANFITPKFVTPGAELYEKLLLLGVIVRPVANYDMPMYLRITVGDEAMNARVISSLDQVLSEN